MNRIKINLALENSKQLDNMKVILEVFQQKLKELVEEMTPEERKTYSDELWLQDGGQP